MPKHKTRKSVAKRFRKTASGKIKYTKAGRGHLLSGKRRKRKRSLRKPGIVNASDMKRISALL